LPADPRLHNTPVPGGAPCGCGCHRHDPPAIGWCIDCRGAHRPAAAPVLREGLGQFRCTGATFDLPVGAEYPRMQRIVREMLDEESIPVEEGDVVRISIRVKPGAARKRVRRSPR
jgi:hypothetical protein